MTDAVVLEVALEVDGERVEHSTSAGDRAVPSTTVLLKPLDRRYRIGVPNVGKIHG